MVYVKSVKKLMSGTIASVMFLCSVPVQSIVTAADAAEPIGVIELNNIFTHLSYGAAPSFTTYLSADSALHMSIRDEAWAVVGSDDGIYRNANDIVPYPKTDEDVYYSYYVLLQADSGYTFTDTFTLYYDGMQVSMMDYDYTLYSSGNRIMLRCDFIGAICPDYSVGTITEISTISLNNISTQLRCGEAPAFTAYLSPDSAGQMTLANEAWAVIGKEGGVLRSTGDVIPYPENGEPEYYSYYVQLKAKEGYVFTDDFNLFYDGEPVSMMDYDAELYESKDILVIRCDFLGTFEPASGSTVMDAIYLEDISFNFTGGDAPVFSAKPADHSGFRLITEGWRGEGEAVFSKSGYNTAEYLNSASLLTTFRSGRNYTYFVWLESTDGYIFDYTGEFRLYLNGVEYPYHLNVMQNGIELQIADLLTVPAAATTKTITTTTKAVTTTTTKAVTTTTKTTTVTTATTTTTATVRTTAPADPDLLYGDINADGKVSVSDAVLLARFLAEELKRDLSETGLRAADIDRDGIISILDEMLLLKLLQQQTETPVIVPPKDAAVSDGTDPDPFGLPDTSSFNWIRDPGGDSAAFTEEVLGRLTVSADENALSYDGQLQFSELDDEEAKALDQRLAAYDTLMLDAWHIEAGLKPDEHLPGYYTCSYDLSALEIPAELYEQLSLLRIDDDGTITEYPIEIEGDTLSWMSDQNSVAVLVMIGKGLLVAIEIYLVANAPEYIQWLKEGDGCVGSFETDRFTIWYQDNEPQETKDARTKRLQEIEADATRKAREYAEEKVGDNWGPIAGLFMNYVTEVNKAAAKKKNELLADNTEYQDLMTLENGHPADVVLLARQYDIAMDYLYYQENCPRLKKPDIIFNPVLENLGEASLNYIYKNYMLIMRTVQEDNAHIDKDTSYWDLYGTAVPSEVCDQLLTTLTHELYHLVQATKLVGKLESNTKFFEMSALTIECHAADYYMQEEHKYIQTHKLDEGQCFETFGLPMDQVSASLTEQNHNLQTVSGYSLSYFWRHIEKIQKKQIKGWDMILGYKKYGSISELINHLFGFSESSAMSRSGNKNDVLNVYWAHYQKQKETEMYAFKSMEILFNEKSQYTEDSKHYYPSLIITHRLSSEKTQSYSIVKAKDLACTCVGVSGAKDRPWSLILERDADFGELQPEHQFLFAESADKYSGTESRKGAVVSSQKSVMYYRELQGFSEGGKSGYMIHYIPSPDTPDVTIDEEAEIVTVKLKSQPSTEGTAGLTDRFLLVFNVNGKETYTQTIGYDKWQEETKIPLDSLMLSPNQKNSVKVTVCELIDAGTDRAGQQRSAVRTAACKPFEQTLGEAAFPVIDTDVKVQLTYGNFDVSSVNAHFTLNQKGEFLWRIDDHTWEAGSDSPTNPFTMSSGGVTKGGSITGFTVKGKAQNSDDGGIDPTNWDGIITECSPAQFEGTSNYLSWDGKIYEDAPDNFTRWEVMSQRSVSGGFSGNVIGTLHFKYSELLTKQYEITLVLSPTLTCKEVNTLTKPGTYSPDIRIGSFEEKKAEDSVKITAKLNAQ